ncbi:MAG: glycosyltransferase family 2 protein [Candidatus Kerfeldbacteria bacterium]|nr:glycosyltransferase family 2 protein [Candidatus Kerfeldbacteria bacterium]
MLLSVLIVNWNTRDALASCLAALLPALNGIEAEVIVVDNGSTDGSAQFARDSSPSVRLMENRENRGFAEANNQAFAQATGEFILLLNNDAVLRPSDVDQLLAPLRADATLGGTIPTLLNEDGSTQYGYHRRRATVLRLLGTMLHNGGLWPGNPWARAYLMLDDDLSRNQTVEEPAAACLLLRRRAIEDSGGLFDADRFPIHFNDADLAKRLTAHRWRVQLVSSVRVQHVGGKTVRRIDPYLLKTFYQVSFIAFVRSFRPAPVTWLVKGVLLTLDAALLGFTSLGLLHRFFGTPIEDRAASLRAQRQLLTAVAAEALPALPTQVAANPLPIPRKERILP